MPKYMSFVKHRNGYMNVDFARRCSLQDVVKNADGSRLCNVSQLFLADLGEIPDTIKLCKSLQAVDFSSNPLQK
jgi:hypothetical protein